MMQNPIDWVGTSLDIVNGITDIVEKGMFSENERIINRDMRKVAILAKSNLRAARANKRIDKLTVDRILYRVKSVELGLRIAAKHGLKKDKLTEGLQKLVEMLTECAVSNVAE